MDHALATLLTTTATIALVHTLIGVDHYLPFIVLGRAGGWKLRKTLLWTAICGLGHVLSSVALAAAGGALGWAAGSYGAIDAVRGDLAAYLLIGFGLLYALVGIWRKGHTHAHVHDDGTVHTHTHHHEEKREGDHEDVVHSAAHQRTLWALLIIFVLGPCEPLIPLLVAPAVAHDVGGLLAVVGLFSAITIGTMLAAVTVGHFGLSLVRLGRLQRWAHPLAGAAITVSGLLILCGL